MKKTHFILSSILGLAFSGQSNAASYACDGFSGVDEYRSTVDLSEKTADFFDNDVTSLMSLSETKTVISPAQEIYIFRGPDAGTKDSTLVLTFNLTKLTAKLVSTPKQGKKTNLGSVKCELIEEKPASHPCDKKFGALLKQEEGDSSEVQGFSVIDRKTAESMISEAPETTEEERQEISSELSKLNRVAYEVSWTAPSNSGSSVYILDAKTCAVKKSIVTWSEE